MQKSDIEYSLSMNFRCKIFAVMQITIFKGKALPVQACFKTEFVYF